MLFLPVPGSDKPQVAFLVVFPPGALSKNVQLNSPNIKCMVSTLLLKKVMLLISVHRILLTGDFRTFF